MGKDDGNRNIISKEIINFISANYILKYIFYKIKQGNLKN
jgi:hypothetical protein